jgi:rhamnose utilization protein RhaD (predicted bifunctional aldolase and dehydrogenase)
MPGLEQLVELSRRLGIVEAYVQGGGGNTSFKDGDHRMWIKASGVELATVEALSGFVPVDYQKTLTMLDNCRSEADYIAMVGQAVITADATNSRRPSIETGFHALLGKVVLHSHSVWGNLINCCADGESLLKGICPKALWVSYVTPGLPLTKHIRSYIKVGSGNTILFLQNHGVIVSASDTDVAWKLHEDVNMRIRRHFKLPDIYQPVENSFIADTDHMLFPDQAVYLGHEASRFSKAGIETQQAYDFLSATMAQLSLKPHYLPQAEAQTLINMEAEKYRQKVAQV